MMIKTRFRSTLWMVSFLLCVVGVMGVSVIALPALADPLVLEDFSMKGPDGFPKGWEAQRNMGKAQKSYVLHSEGDLNFLSAKGAGQRVFKKMKWDPKGLPIITWKWRLKAAPSEGTEPYAAVYISLDTDLLVIPVSTKYIWSPNLPKGTIKEGGMFSASELVVRSGAAPIGEWVEERVNAYEDFVKIHQHEPAKEAWGISLLASPDIEVDFGPISASGN